MFVNFFLCLSFFIPIISLVALFTRGQAAWRGVLVGLVLVFSFVSLLLFYVYEVGPVVVTYNLNVVSPTMRYDLVSFKFRGLEDYWLRLILEYWVRYYDYFSIHPSFFFYRAYYIFSNFFVGDIMGSLVFFFDELSVAHMWLVVLLSIVSLGLIIRQTESVKNQNTYLNRLVICLIFLLLNLYLIFSTADLLWFYIWFELSIVPMAYLIGFWGSRNRRIIAVFKFFLYTMFGSIFLLLSILFVYSLTGTFSLFELNVKFFSLDQQIILWLLLFIAFAVKVPMYPFHVWLPEAHAEAPTVGSIILAGIMLKLGPYGLLRFVLFLYPAGTLFFTPIVSGFCIVGLVYTSVVAVFETDVKKIVAYSSIGHMAFVILGLLSNTMDGVVGALVLMLSHGFVSSGLFLCIGLLYERYGTRIVMYYGGLGQVNPVLMWLMFIFFLANMGFPGTFSFVGEFLILYGLFYNNVFIFLVSALSSVFIVGYNMWLFTRLFGGALGQGFTGFSRDLTIREVYIVLWLVVPTILFGVWPEFFINMFNTYYFSFFDYSYYQRLIV